MPCPNCGEPITQAYANWPPEEDVPYSKMCHIGTTKSDGNTVYVRHD